MLNSHHMKRLRQQWTPWPANTLKDVPSGSIYLSQREVEVVEEEASGEDQIAAVAVAALEEAEVSVIEEVVEEEEVAVEVDSIVAEEHHQHQDSQAQEKCYEQRHEHAHSLVEIKR